MGLIAGITIRMVLPTNGFDGHNHFHRRTDTTLGRIDCHDANQGRVRTRGDAQVNIRKVT